MPAVVFISCGQGEPREREAAQEVARWLSSKGFEPYIAVNIQTLLDLNSEVISSLKKSDYFLFINFRRERLPNGKYRGSLFANQELAIAYSLGFENPILINQKEALREGIFGFIVSNSPEFEDYGDLVSVVSSAVENSSWTPDFSRNLTVAGIRWGLDVWYDDHSTTDLPTGRRFQRHCLADIRNSRIDHAAINTTVRLCGYTDRSSGKWYPSPDRTNLKAAGRYGYTHTIWQQSTEAFDLFALPLNESAILLLNSEHDFRKRLTIIDHPGEFELEYEILAQAFQPVKFRVLVELGSHADSTNAILDNGQKLLGINRPH
jgi:hypothetical protein